QFEAELVTKENEINETLCIIKKLNFSFMESYYLLNINNLTSIKLKETIQLKLTHAIEKSLNEIYIFNEKSLKFEFVNEGARNNLGYESDELSNMTPIEIKPLFDRGSFHKLLEQLNSGSETKIIFQTIHKRKNNSVYPVEVHLQKIDNNKESFYLAIINDITKRKDTEEKLNFQAKIINNFTDAIIVTDDQFKIIYWNNYAEYLYGWKFSEVEGKNIKNFIITEFENANALENNKNSLLLKGKWKGEVIQNTKNGEKVYISSSIAIFNSDDKGNKNYILTVNRNINEAKKSEKKLEETKESLEKIIQTIPAIVFLKDAKYLKYELVNDSFTKIFNIPKESVIGKTDSEVFNQTQALKTVEDDKFVLTNKITKDILEEEVKINNQTFYFHTLKTSIYDDEKEPLYLLGIAINITETKLMRDELEKSKEQLQLALDSAELGLWDLNFQTGENIINGWWAKMLGYSLEEIEGNYNFFDSIIHPEDRYKPEEAIRNILEGKETSINLELRMKAKDGSWKWILDKGKILSFDEFGRPLRAIGTHLDITEKKEQEEEIRELLEEKEILLKEVHHRIKNNMSSISGLLTLQALELDDNPKAQDALQNAKNRILSMMLIYDKLYKSTDFSNLSSEEYIENLVSEIHHTFPGSEKISIIKNIEDMKLSSKTLFPLGIILNEVITNCFKYAFP
ncbi:MAG: PAS domain S-box protein, partial [Leptospiraceae bacterium]|nr:PAS domain S-box protein [Leptospiraceae bacterium]